MEDKARKEEQKNRLAKILKRELRTKRPTIYLVMDCKTGRGLPTSWASAYIMQDGQMKKLWAPWAMRRRRTDGNLYWHEHSWGTPHTFCLVESILHAAGLNDFSSRTANRFYTEVL